jgi:hypothetical protein
VEVDGVGAGRAELGQAAEDVAGGAGDTHGQHPGVGLAQGGGVAGGLAGPWSERVRFTLPPLAVVIAH